MSVVRVQVTGQEPLDRAARLLAGVEGGVDKALKRAMTKATKRLRSKTASAIRERYAISAGNIRGDENVKVSYSYGNGVQARVLFNGRKIPLFRFDGASPKGPAYDMSRWESVEIGGEWKRVHPGVPAHGHVLNSTGPVTFQNAFVATMGSGHTGIFERTGGETSGGGDAIEEKMGLSVPQMLGHETVAEKLANEAMEAFEDDLNDSILAILSGI